MKFGIGGGVEWYGPLLKILLGEGTVGFAGFVFVEKVKLWVAGDLHVARAGGAV